MNDENLRSHSEALELCAKELSRPYPDFQAAQVYATLGVEEALRDLAAAISSAAHEIARVMR